MFLLQPVHSPVHQALLLHQPLRLLPGNAAMKPRLGLVDGCEQKHIKDRSMSRTEGVLDRDPVSSHVDLQEGLAPEFRLGRLHLRASLLCISEEDQREQREVKHRVCEGAYISP